MKQASAAVLLFAASVCLAGGNVAVSKEAPDRSSPRKTWDSYLDAMKNNDAAACGQCLTDAALDVTLYEMFNYIGQTDKKAFDRVRPFLDTVAYHNRLEAMPPTDEPEKRAIFATAVKDKAKMFAEIITFVSDSAKREKTPELSEVTIEGNRAWGVMGKDGQTKYFAKTKDGWLIDAHTPEEEKAEIERIRMEAKRKIESKGEK